jgi:hypothetical protein
LYSLAQDVSVIAALDNRTNVFFRLIANDTVSANGGAVVAAGTSSWGGNCTVSSIPAVVPLPGAVWLLGGGILAIGGLVRRPNA